MDFFIRCGGVRRWIAAVLAAAVTSACMAWQREAAGPGALAAQQADRAQVILVRGDTLLLLSPRVRGDTLSGYVRVDRDSVATGVPLSEIAAVETYQVSTLRTALLSFVLLGGVIVVAASRLHGMFGGSYSGSGCFLCGLGR